MDEQREAPGGRAPREGAIDIDDFVHAATGTRVRRLTMPDGTHWFPAADVLRALGYANPDRTFREQVPAEARTSLAALTERYGVAVPPGQRLRKSLRMVDLAGLLVLVAGSTEPATRPFKRWVARVIATVRREGSYALDEAEIQPAAASGAPAAHAMPREVADALVRLERQALDGDGTTVDVPRTVAEAQRRSVLAMRDVMVDVARSMSRLADSVEDLVDRMPPRPAAPPAEPRVPRRGGPVLSAGQVLTAWRARLTVTDDAWAVAVLLAPALAERGEVRLGVGTIAARTGLTPDRARDGLRSLLEHECIRRIGTVHDTPVYELRRA
ncbi:BRO-N domain-containing protein [Streptomyces specialis]|uniref:BRO-N domain-containing protein n=1 Tax=Streptomyces specialis TaxID=498367 RepID=UPI00073E73E2|nr:BRO family protein [Streptomyces specialis]